MPTSFPITDQKIFRWCNVIQEIKKFHFKRSLYHFMILYTKGSSKSPHVYYLFLECDFTNPISFNRSSGYVFLQHTFPVIRLGPPFFGYFLLRLLLLSLFLLLLWLLFTLLLLLLLLLFIDPGLNTVHPQRVRSSGRKPFNCTAICTCYHNVLLFTSCNIRNKDLKLYIYAMV